MKSNLSYSSVAGFQLILRVHDNCGYCPYFQRQALAGGDVEPVAELFGRWQTEDYIPPPAVDVRI